MICSTNTHHDRPVDWRFTIITRSANQRHRLRVSILQTGKEACFDSNIHRVASKARDEADSTHTIKINLYHQPPATPKCSQRLSVFFDRLIKHTVIAAVKQTKTTAIQ
jgi:hypothetical protein